MRLFEFATALDEDANIVRNIKGICFIISGHNYDRMNDRPSVTPEKFELLLRKIPNLRNKYKELPISTPTNVWSKSLNIGVGVRKYADKDGYQRLYVGTVLDKPLFDNDSVVNFYVG